MCGICGWIQFSSDSASKILENERIVSSMNEAQRRRGPDDGNTWISEKGTCIFGHRRLIVVDPAGGAQPMSRNSLDGSTTYTIVYNGELYNTEELRKELIAKGYKFSVYSDTEVLLTAYIEWGEDCLSHLNGIFALAIWNDSDESLFIARDRLGVKPFFYSNVAGNGIIFASELKGILIHPLVSSDVPFERLETIFAFPFHRMLGFVPFKDVEELLPGHAGMVTKNGKIRIWKYWDLQRMPFNDTLDQAAEKLKNMLKRATESQMTSDVPFGSLLSGGIDSTAIVSFSNPKIPNGQRLQTFSLGLPQYDKYFAESNARATSDMYFTELVVNKLGLDHHTIVQLTSAELIDVVEDCTRAKDYPVCGDLDTSMLAMFRGIKPQATMLLSGEGSDEIFGGYGWMHVGEGRPPLGFTMYSDFIRDELKPRLDLKRRIAQHYADAGRDCPEFEGDSKEEREFRKVIYLHIKQFLPFMLDRKDRTSMWSGVEVRVPFLDHNIVQYAFQLPLAFKYQDGVEKIVLKKAMEGVEDFPEEIRIRKKTPYPAAVDPETQRLAIELLKDLVSKPDEPIFKFFDHGRVKDELENGFQHAEFRVTDPITFECLNLYSLNFWFKLHSVNVVGY